IEGGWPGSNPLDDAFFREIRSYKLRQASITAFGSTHHPGQTAENDQNLRALVESGVSCAAIFGKAWDEHVREALKVSNAQNLKMVADSVAFLKSHGLRVFFDAEHFFDGYATNPEYAVAVLDAAHAAGAETLVLCDTNGGGMTEDIYNITREMVRRFPNAAIGIHAHNDCELAVANSIAAVEAGAVHVQGTINGIGERCGNANLISIIPILALKSEAEPPAIPRENLGQLTGVASYVAEIANMPLFSRQPFVGRSAFAHKGGIHVSAVSRRSYLYEHIDPELVGNQQRVLITALAGRSNIIAMAKRYGFHLDKNEPVVRGLFNDLKEKTAMGYDYAAAEASVELLLLKKLGRRGVRDFFRLINLRVLETKDDKEILSEATITLQVEGMLEHTAAYGQGPVNALDSALRKALSTFYPKLKEMRLLDFKVRVLNSNELKDGGTASVVRVLIESGDANGRWVTVGVSHDIIEASWQALADSFTYKLYRDEYSHRASTAEE
ncbi:MAG: citramalate synthase, partial [Desulfovibrionaceae bacterium]|nr:citramalate synthase [Desulfovibrionaceae bacterium]